MLTNLKNFAVSLRRDEKGATAIEYGLIAAFISIAMIATLRVMGPRLDGIFQQVSAALNVGG